MRSENFRALVPWLRALDRLLTRGSSAADLKSLQKVLSQAPEGWHEMPARARGWRDIPCWARVFSNANAEPGWVQEAVSLCTKAGAVHDNLEVDERNTQEPTFMALTAKLGYLNAETYTHYALSRLSLGTSLIGFPSYQIAWLDRVFARSDQWKDGSVSPRVVIWKFLDAFPVFRSSPLAEKVWAMGLGLTSRDTYAPRMVEFAAMNGLNGNVMLHKEMLPPASLDQWPSGDLGPWREAPAWGWALLKGVFRGSRMLVREVQESQPSPWNPNALLPDKKTRAGDWLLKASFLPSRPSSSPGAMLMELDELGFEWGKGVLGKRAIDLLRERGLGPGILGEERWSQIMTQAEECLMDTTLPEAVTPHLSKGRL